MLRVVVDRSPLQTTMEPATSGWRSGCPWLLAVLAIVVAAVLVLVLVPRAAYGRLLTMM